VKRGSWIFLGLILILLISGCETFRGFGKDMQRAGRAIERTTER
jgi:predicted small secreted protein